MPLLFWLDNSKSLPTGLHASGLVPPSNPSSVQGTIPQRPSWKHRTDSITSLLTNLQGAPHYRQDKAQTPQREFQAALGPRPRLTSPPSPCVVQELRVLPVMPVSILTSGLLLPLPPHPRFHSARIWLRRHLLQAASSGSWASLALHSQYFYDPL